MSHRTELVTRSVFLSEECVLELSAGKDSRGIHNFVCINVSLIIC